MASAREDGSGKCKCQGRWNACELCFYILCTLRSLLLYNRYTQNFMQETPETRSKILMLGMSSEAPAKGIWALLDMH